MDKERHSNWMPNIERVKEIKRSMDQKVYLLENVRLPNTFIRRDLLKVNPPTAAEALARAEDDEKTHGGRPVGTTRPKAKAKAKPKAKPKARPIGRRLGGGWASGPSK